MPSGGARLGAGRPATGKTTAVLTIRLPLDMVETIRRRAKANEQSVSEYLRWSLQHDFRPRASRRGYRDRRTPQIKP